MKLPSVPYPNNSRSTVGQARRQQTLAFGGLDYTYSARAGKMSDCMNLSTRNYPALSPRLGMRRDAHYNAATAAFSWDDKLVVVDGTDLIYDGTVKGQVITGPKQFAVVNTKLCVWPDKVCVDLTTGTFHRLDAAIQTIGDDLAYDGDTITGDDLPGELEPEDLVTISGTWQGMGDVTDGRVVSVDRDSITFAEDTFPRVKSRAPVPQDTTYQAGATICLEWLYRIAGTTYTAYYPIVLPKTVAYKDVFYTAEYYPASGYPDTLPPAELTVGLWNRDAKETVFTVVSTGATEAPAESVANLRVSNYHYGSGTVTFTRKVPDLDFICESGNRLWGISNRQTNTVWNPETGEPDTFTSRVIYASALGDPTKWWTFEGVDTDSWQVAVGSEGDFTGLIPYGGAVCCFKEKRLVRVLGDYPSQYSTAEEELEGVAPGSGKSLCVVGGLLLYHGTAGFYAYGGGQPRLISENLGLKRYTNAVAGTDGRRYFVSATKPAVRGSNAFFAWDSLTGLWFLENEFTILDFIRIGGETKFLNTNGNLVAIDGADADYWTEKPVSWFAEFAPFPEEDGHDRRRYLRLLLRTDTRDGGTVKVKVKFNGEDTWRTVKTITAEDNNGGVQTTVIPVFPNRIDRMRVRLDGDGDVRILSLAREYLDDGTVYGGEANA